MRSIGSAEMALSSIIFRIRNRFAFGSMLEEKDSIRQVIAEARIQLTMCRKHPSQSFWDQSSAGMSWVYVDRMLLMTGSLCYLAAVIADERGFKDAKKYIAMIKVDAPRMALKIIDDAMQVHGAHGVSQDSELSGMYSHMRTLRVADGPDIVHMNTIVKEELKSPLNPLAAKVSGVNPNIHKYKKAVLPHGYYDDYFAMEENQNQTASVLDYRPGVKASL
jgi:acyl-CoA dehydrogenase